MVSLSSRSCGYLSMRFKLRLATCNLAAFKVNHYLTTGPTALIAAMRAHVASKFGEEVPPNTLLHEK